MRFGVVRFPGAIGVDEVLVVVGERLAAQGSTGHIIDHEQATLGDVDAIIIPSCVEGEAGSSPIMAAVQQFAADGGPVLGIGGGFGVLCQAGLLDGAVEVCTNANEPTPTVHCVVEGVPTPFTHAIPAGRHVELRAHATLDRYTHPDIDALEAEGRAVLRYCTFDGEVCAEANRVGAANNIAGICNVATNVVGLMLGPHITMLQSALAYHTGVPARVGG